MVIDKPTAQRFIPTYMAFLDSLLSAKDKAGKDVIAQLAIGRDRYCADRTLLDAYRAAHPEADAQMLDAIAHSQMGNWVHLKGLIQNPVWLGPGYKRQYTASYTALRKAGEFSLGLAA